MHFMQKIVNPTQVDYGRPLDAPIPNAPNFCYGEFIASDSAMRRRIPNIPSEEHWKNIEYLAANIIQPIRQTLGVPIRISSGYRCPNLNAAVGGSSRSHHCHGRAADLDPLGIDGNEVLLDMLNVAVYGDGTNRLPAWEVIMEDFPTGWLHVAHNNGQLRDPNLTTKIMVKKHDRHQLPIFNDKSHPTYIDPINDPKGRRVAQRLGIAIPADYYEIQSYMAGDLTALDQAILRAYQAL